MALTAVQQPVSGMSTRHLCGLTVLDPDGACLGHVSVTVSGADGRRYAIVRRGHPHWQLLLVDVLRRRHPSRRATRVCLDSAYLGSDTAIHLLPAEA
jgi:hypothetical protein